MYHKQNSLFLHPMANISGKRKQLLKNQMRQRLKSNDNRLNF